MNSDLSTDAIKAQVLRAVPHWLLLEIDDIRKSLSVGLTLTAWNTEGRKEGYVFLAFRSDVGLNFESWAHRNWKWDGEFEICVVYLPPGKRVKSENDYREYEIKKEQGQRPFVLDCRNGQLWMQAR
jgi:hypothetical protein